ncbi:hypothetical protein ACFX5U_20675 [Sphingobacterium sp. SG20118]|uniref:hypothetical protein n=1 Tax=Sphingobacterium sp. SG20118 TaxID=3367156 RepID=UPI0037DFC9F8
MTANTYDAKALLGALMEIEYRLDETINEHCPSSELTFDGDLDKALNDFLGRREVHGNEQGYLLSQLALLHLRKEFAKAKGTVVESNNLRAVHDYQKSNPDMLQAKSNQNGKQRWIIGFSMVLSALIGWLVGTGMS